ncbi:hypothetical protein [Erwinia tasmaniensis]|nr:hypothetical protein [Erwinia tasmaniensis]
MFGHLVASELHTPFAIVNATQAANSGNRFCIKPLPPGVTCTVTLPPKIDHGEMMAPSRDKKTLYGSLSCGNSPVLEIVGASDVELAPGVRTQLKATLLSNNQIQFESDLSVEKSAKPGEYSKAIVVSVSPY